MDKSQLIAQHTSSDERKNRKLERKGAISEGIEKQRQQNDCAEKACR
jgi:hypothetical protein